MKNVLNYSRMDIKSFGKLLSKIEINKNFK